MMMDTYQQFTQSFSPSCFGTWLGLVQDKSALVGGRTHWLQRNKTKNALQLTPSIWWLWCGVRPHICPQGGGTHTQRFTGVMNAPSTWRSSLPCTSTMPRCPWPGHELVQPHPCRFYLFMPISRYCTAATPFEAAPGCWGSRGAVGPSPTANPPPPSYTTKIRGGGSGSARWGGRQLGSWAAYS